MLILQEALALSSDDIIFLGIGSNREDILVEISYKAFKHLGNNIDSNILLDIDAYTRGIIVCCQDTSNSEVHFLSRFFGPKVGILEDPVTGSAHCLLAPYFWKILKKSTLVGYQASNRGGIISCILNDDQDGNRSVTIQGSALFTLSGNLSID